MSRVLFATDLSEAAGVAERLIGTIAWPPETTFRVVTVVPWVRDLVGTPWMAVAPMNADEIEASQIAWAEGGVREATARFAAAGRTASWVVMRGQPADAIVDVAKRESVDLIVVGGRGLNALEGALLGSVSEAVADRAPCPVLIARRAELARSIIADDGSAGAEDAIAYVLKRRHLLGAETRLLGVRPVSDLWAETFEMPIDARGAQAIADNRDAEWATARAVLEADALQLQGAGQPTVVELEEGRPGSQIVDAALRWRADLVVVGSRHRTGVTRLVLGSVGRHVLHHSHASVLLVGHVPANGTATQAPAEPVAVG
jgi:nucleotide-binding universal stress UspA family protein